MPENQETATVGQSATAENPADVGGAQTTQSQSDIQSNGASGASLSANQPEIAKGTAYNVLHNYRSWNYIFTISALTPDSLSQPDNYKNSSLKYVIARSAGKGSRVIDNQLSSMVVNTKEINSAQIVDMINEFNKSSPGRFDFFIDNVEINSIMTASEASNTSLATKIKFDILEPYSMGGFLEALEVSSRAVGALNYAGAIFVLKIEFWGYRDSDNVNDPPKEIEGGTRYFPMVINKVEIEASDKGTLYRVQATPVNEMGFGETNKIRSDIKMVGSTVGDCIKDFFDSLNNAVKEEARKIKGGTTTNYDEYEVVYAT